MADALIFDLTPGDKFVLGETTHIVRRFFKKRRPKIGVVLHCETIDADGRAHWFLNNWKVLRVDSTPE